jgi:hydrogenase maturation protein HypF
MWTIKVTGVVQGVGFRPAVVRAAIKTGTRGSVRNDGSHVTIMVDKDPEGFLRSLRNELGPMALVEDTIIDKSTWSAVGIEEPADFTILASTKGERDSSLPCDTAICSECFHEMMDPGNRRFLHPFTNCTDCGARYTLIDSLPYDRERTSMAKFDHCEECSGEYGNRAFRRFHAQTLSCGKDGPSYRYLDRDLEERSRDWDSFLDCARAIVEGKLLVVKGWGGMHIVSHPMKLKELRSWYKRPFKPFAIMIRDIDTAYEVASVHDHEKELLMSSSRPIVLLTKKEDPPDWAREPLEDASPGLGNIGLYLPYSGIHHLLFKALEEIGSPLRWFVMTSANPPGEPMALSLDDASKMKADGYFVHDRKISARCDDSVLVPFSGYKMVRAKAGPFGMKSLPIRRSRGMVPEPLAVPHARSLLSMGAERNVSISVTKNGKIFTSPYVGNTRHPDVLQFASDTAERFRYLFGVDEIEAVVIDRHPRYTTRKLGKEISEDEGVELIEVQHHHAHAASLMVDASLNELTTIVIDGVGFGDDGIPWGGEVIRTKDDEYIRVGQLEEFGLPGGDGAAYHPERIAYWLTQEAGDQLELGDPWAMEVLNNSHHRAVMTSSLGRVLDGLSSLMLGIKERTYDGEPAIRLEKLLSMSHKPRYDLFVGDEPDYSVSIIARWKKLLDEVKRISDKVLKPGLDIDNAIKADLSMGFVGSIIDDMVSVALVREKMIDVEREPLIGISGGVSYNIPIVGRFVETCRKEGAMPVLHSRVPPGDGGISVGQAYIAGLQMKQV